MAQSRKVNCDVYQFYTEKDGKREVLGKLPKYGTTEAACADIFMPVREVIKPHESRLLDTWIGFEIPKGYKVLMYPRSSLLIKRGLMSPVSVIDQDYSGQVVHVPVHNLTDEEVVIEAGERIAQVECVPAYNCVDWEHSDKVREGGFGSTGK